MFLSQFLWNIFILISFIGLYFGFEQLFNTSALSIILTRHLVKPLWFLGCLPFTLCLVQWFKFKDLELTILLGCIPFISCGIGWLIKRYQEERIVYKSNQLIRYLKKELPETLGLNPSSDEWSILVYPNRNYYMISCKYPKSALKQSADLENLLKRLIQSYYVNKQIDLRLKSL